MNTFNLIYGISYIGMVAMTFAAGITYYILRTAYIEMNNSDELQVDTGAEDGRNDLGYNPGS